MPRKTTTKPCRPLDEVILWAGLAPMTRGVVYTMLMEDGLGDFAAAAFAFRGEAIDVPAGDVLDAAQFRALWQGRVMGRDPANPTRAELAADDARALTEAAARRLAPLALAFEAQLLREYRCGATIPMPSGDCYIEHALFALDGDALFLREVAGEPVAAWQVAAAAQQVANDVALAICGRDARGEAAAAAALLTAGASLYPGAETDPAHRIIRQLVAALDVPGAARVAWRSISDEAARGLVDAEDAAGSVARPMLTMTGEDRP